MFLIIFTDNNFEKNRIKCETKREKKIKRNKLVREELIFWKIF